MIYDCFPFFNELDLLEIRLHELADVVDYFVLSEATVTHQNNPKPLYFEQNKDRFKDFEDKIIHNVISNASDLYKGNPWNIDHYMHDHVHSTGRFNPDDIIIIGDADQIVRADVLKNFAYTGPLQLQMQYSYYFFNCIHTDMVWESSFIVKRKDMQAPAHKIRYHPDQAGLSFTKVPNAGWHFSYMGGIEKIKEKIRAFSDTNVNRPEFMDDAHLLNAILEGKDLYNRTCEGRMAFEPLNNSYPKYILDNKDKFARHIREV